MFGFIGVFMVPRGIRLLLILLLLLAAGCIRLFDLEHAPPRICVDEASNGYDAYCLLETGADRWGESWPVFLEAFGRGDFRPALYAYMIVPFVWALGPEELTIATRLPAVILSVGSILCFYLLVARVFDRKMAIWAAVLLALSPWHIQISRFGHESTLVPTFVILLFLLADLSGILLRGTDGEKCSSCRLKPVWAIVFAAVAALSLYSYGTMKLFLPAMAIVGGFIYRKQLLAHAKNRNSRRVLIVAGFVFAIVAAPMVWGTLTRWSQVNARALSQSIIHQDQPILDSLVQICRQYLSHFGMTWLFITGDLTIFQSVSTVGQLNWYMLPVLPIGLAVMWYRRRDNRAYGLILAWLLLYPIASATTLSAPHSLRAACGIGVFQWIGAIGIYAILSWRPINVSPIRQVTSSLIAVVLVINCGWFMTQYFRQWAYHPYMKSLMGSDLVDAVFFMRDRWRNYDRIFISDQVNNEHVWFGMQPYIQVLFYLPVEPSEFQSWEKKVEYCRGDKDFDDVRSMGPFTMSTSREVLAEHFEKHPREKVLIVARPGDISGGRLLATIRNSRGEVRFQIVEVLPQ